jgi:hypothetical protein
VPLSTLTNWTLEFEKWAPAVRCVILKGGPLQRKEQYGRIRSGDFQVCMTTYEYVIKERPLLSKIKWVHMIIDEGHRMKNVKSKLSQTLNEYYTTRYRLILTGTPLQVSFLHHPRGFKLTFRTICQNFGRYSISSYLKSSTPSNHSMIGSMPHSPIPVVKRWR